MLSTVKDGVLVCFLGASELLQSKAWTSAQILFMSDHMTSVLVVQRDHSKCLAIMKFINIWEIWISI